MATEALRSDANTHDAGWPTTPNEILFETAATAETTDPDDEIILSGFNFSALPQTCTIAGIVVRIDGYKIEDVSNNGALYFGAAMTWNGGTNWSAERKTPLITATLIRYELGGTADTWSHTWTRSEIASSNFKLRIKSKAFAVLGNPSWAAAYATVIVYYTDSGTTTYRQTEQVGISERIVLSKMVIQVRELIEINDSGSTPRAVSTEVSAVPEVQQLALSGSAIEELLLTAADFETGSQIAKRKEAIGIRISLSPTGPVFFIGDSTLCTERGLDFPLSSMQPGLISVSDINSEGSFGGEYEYTSCEIVLSNKLYINQTSQATEVTGPKTIPEHLQGKPSIGGTLYVWALIEAGEGWQKRLLLDGRIEEIQIGERQITVRGVVVGTMTRPVPDLYVDENSFAYEPQSVADTGKKIPGSQGKPVPIGIGRFDITAVTPIASFDSGSPYIFTQDLGASVDIRRFTSSAFWPALFGAKFPMMPTIHAATKYRRTKGDNGGITDFRSWHYLNVYLYGSRKNSPPLQLCIDPLYPATLKDLELPGVEFGLNDDTLNIYSSYRYKCIWTWNRQEDVGIPFVQEQSIRVGLTATYKRLQRMHSAGKLDDTGFPSQEPLTWSDGTAKEAYAVFTQSAFYTDWSVYDRAQFMLPPLQCIAIPFARTTIDQGAMKWYTIDEIIELGRGAQPYSPQFITTATNPGNCIDIRNLETYTTIANGQSVALQAPETFPSQGTLVLLRVCALWHREDTTAEKLWVVIRWGNVKNRGILPEINDLSFEMDGQEQEGINALWDDTKLRGAVTNELISAMRLPTGVSGGVCAQVYGAVNVYPYWNAIKGIYYDKVDPTRAHTIESRDVGSTPTLGLLPRQVGEWSFMAWERLSDLNPGLQQWPLEVLVMVDDRDGGGALIGGRKAEVYAVWLEAFYTAQQDAKRAPSNIYALTGEPPASGKRRVKRAGSEGYDVRGRRLGPASENPSPTNQESPALYTKQISEPRDSSSTPIFVTGKGYVDSDGTITGTVNRLVENPADIFALLIRHYLGSTVFTTRATGTTFGSFTTARTLLGATSYRLSVVVQEQEDMASIAARIGEQSMGLICEQLKSDGTATQWRFFVDTVNPASSDAQRMYKADAYKFRWDNIVKDSFVASLTPYELLASGVILKYGYHIPSASYSDEQYCMPKQTSLVGGDATTYKNAMNAARYNFNIDSVATIQAPDVWDASVARTLLKYHCNQVRRRRVTVEFETYVSGIDLLPGHVIRFDDEIGDRVKFPGDTVAAWSSKQFNVTQVSVYRDVGQLIRVYVKAVETYSTP